MQNDLGAMLYARRWNDEYQRDRKSEFKVGDKVALKSGSPTMTVSELPVGSKAVKVIWFPYSLTAALLIDSSATAANHSARPESDEFPEETLVKVA